MPLFAYILASQRKGTLHIGYTDNIHRRLTAHRAHSLGGFTAKYNVERLVWYGTHESRKSPRTRERQMKKWRKAWKLELIERFNPTWRDLSSKDSTDKNAWVPPFAGKNGRGKRQ